MEKQSLVHTKPDSSDEQKAQEAQDFYADRPALQVVAEAYSKVIELNPTWFPAEVQVEAFPLIDRLIVLADCPAERAKLFRAFAGELPIEVVYDMPCEWQEQVMSLVLKKKVKTPLDLVRSIEPRLLVTYGDVERMWHDLASRIPWHDDSETTKAVLLAMFVAMLKADRMHMVDGKSVAHPPILTHHQFRTRISFEAWQKFLPVKVRAESDKMWMEAEATGVMFTAMDQIVLIGLENIFHDLPTQFFHPATTLCTEKMGFDASFLKPEVETDKPASSKNETADRPTDEQTEGSSPKAL
jgi:hypothetical protein